MTGEQVHGFLIVLALAATIGAFLIVALCVAAARPRPTRPRDET